MQVVKRIRLTREDLRVSGMRCTAGAVNWWETESKLGPDRLLSFLIILVTLS